MNYPFTALEAREAYAEWGCNCGPTSLAFVLQRHLRDIRCAIPDFENRRYTSPSMMRAALDSLEVPHIPVGFRCPPKMFQREPSLVRIQWTGPWTAPGANPKWAYRQTHWIATFLDHGEKVFDCNVGIVDFEAWKLVTVPELTKLYKRADGGWFPTHIWRILNHANYKGNSTCRADTAASV